jgi:hypothetical protein
MHEILVKLMAIAALTHFRMSLTEFKSCSPLECVQQAEIHSLDTLRMNWKPISVFPNEAKRFNRAHRSRCFERN